MAFGVIDVRPFGSPKANPNLLQRSEVVALINTPHRLVESLHMVQDFRRMWAESGVAEEALLSEAEDTGAAKVCPCIIGYDDD